MCYMNTIVPTPEAIGVSAHTTQCGVTRVIYIKACKNLFAKWLPICHDLEALMLVMRPLSNIGVQHRAS